MKKFFALLLAVSLAAFFATSAMATESRQVALGGPGHYIEDDYNIFFWPGTLPNYPNVVFINLGTWWEGEYDGWCPSYIGCEDVMAMVGASYGLGEDNKYGVLAMFFYHAVPGLNPLSTEYDYWWPGQGTFGGWLDNKFTVMYGYALDGLSFGLSFIRSDNAYTYDDETVTEEDQAAYTTFGAGVRFDIGEEAYGDIAFDLSLASYTDEETFYGDITEDANMMYTFRARVFYPYNNTFTFVPFFEYGHFDFSLQADDPAYTNYGDKAMMFNFGCGANITVNEDNLLIFAIEPFNYMKRQPSEDWDDGTAELKRLVMPRFFLALETDVKDWLTFRLGGMKELVKDDASITFMDVETKESWTWADFAYFMGLGFHVGDFDIDCVINNAVPFRLGYWLTGYQPYEGNDEVPMYLISALYHF